MGCDIHCAIEIVYDRSHATGFVESFAIIEPSRNYEMFGVLAGVRGGEALYPPRGIPSNLSYLAKIQYAMFVSNEQDRECSTISKDRADKYVEQKYSVRMGDNWISNPDYHTPSWLNTEELESCINEYKKRLKADRFAHDRTQYEAILAAMKILEETTNGKARFVFWFDN